MAIKNLGRVVGYSAYEIWLQQGNEGTEADYLESLKGPKGNDGYTPVKGEDYFTEEDLNSLNLQSYYTKEEIDKEGFIGIGTLEFKENSNTPGLYEYWIFGGEFGSFDDVYNNKEPIEIIWDDTSYILESDGNSDWGNLDDFPCYLSLGSERIFTNDTSKYHKVIVKDIRGNVLIGNTIPNEYLNIKLPTNILTTDNIKEFTPQSDYNPVHKKYVDEKIGDISTILATLTTVSEVSE